jgi:hypothetical protein
LYTKDVGFDHQIQFYDFGDGSLGVHESFSVDTGEVAFVDSSGSFANLTELYGKLNPGDNNTPSMVVEADQRAARSPRSQTLTPSTSSDRLPAISQEVSAGTTGTCSGDFYNDGWGGQWFINNYCNAGNFRWCPTNMGWADSGSFTVSWSKWQQMEGDFNLTGHITGGHNQCPGGIFAGGCNWHVDFDYDVQPRHIEIWYFNNVNNGDVHGSSQCGHLHIAFLWN